MKIALLVTLALPLLASEATEQMLDGKLNPAQRSNACFSLRGNTTAEAIDADTKGLRDGKIRACSAENLRRAEAIEPLKMALKDEDPEVRAIAARILGTFERPELAPLIAKAGEDSQLLVATNAIEGLSYYRDRTAAPYFLTLAKRTGIVGSLAIEQLIRLKDPQVLGLARDLMKSPEPADLLAAMRVLGSLGGASDIPLLEEIGKRFPEKLSNRGRGFGFMPAISLTQAAQSSIDQIKARS